MKKRRILMFFVLIVLPIALIALGSFEAKWAQEHSAVAAYAKSQAVLKSLNEAQARGVKYVNTTDGRSLYIDFAKRLVTDEVQSYAPGGFSAVLLDSQAILSRVAIVGGALTLLWFLAGLGYLRWLGGQAMRSRERLLSAFSGGRKFLPAYLVFLMLFLAAAMASVTLFVAPFTFGKTAPDWSSDTYAQKLLMLLTLSGVFMAWACLGVIASVIRSARRAAEPRDVKTLGSKVSREQAPALWAFVERVAARLNTRMPDAIIVGLDQGFFVTEHPVHLRNGEPVPPGRVLYMPLPYLAFMNEAEVAAIVGHEMGHFIGEDTVYSQKFSPIYSAVTGQIEEIVGATKAGFFSRAAVAFNELFLDIFHKAVRYWSRQRELAADALGAQVSGARACALALLRTAALYPRIDEAIAYHWNEGHKALDARDDDSAQATTSDARGQSPIIQRGILADVRQRVADQGMADPRQRLQERQPHPTDTHPRLAERLAALGVSYEPLDALLLLDATDPKASSLLADWGLEQPAVKAGAASAVAASTAGTEAGISAAQARSGAAALRIGQTGMPAASTQTRSDATAARAPAPAAGARAAEASVSATLQQEMDQVTASARQEKIETLTGIIAQVREPSMALTQLQFGLFATVCITITLLLCLALLVAIPVLITHPLSSSAQAQSSAPPPDAMNGLLVLVGILILLSAWFGFALYRILKNRRRPVMTLTEQGLRLAGSPQLLPWTAIADVDIRTVRSYGVATVTFHLTAASGNDLTAILGASRKIKHDKRKNRWNITLAGLKYRYAETAVAAFMNYWRAGLARAELRRMGVEPASLDITAAAQPARAGVMAHHSANRFTM